MTCAEFREAVFDYLEGGLRDRAVFQEHFAACAACASLLRGIEENERILAQARVPAAPADLWPEIARAISAARPRRAPARRWAAWAAAAAVVVFVLSLFFSAQPSLDVVIEEVPPSSSALRAFVPSYEEFDPAGPPVRSHP